MTYEEERVILLRSVASLEAKHEDVLRRIEHMEHACIEQRKNNEGQRAIFNRFLLVMTILGLSGLVNKVWLLHVLDVLLKVLR